MVHYVPIYRKHPKYFNKEKNLEYFSFFNKFDSIDPKICLHIILLLLLKFTFDFVFFYYYYFLFYFLSNPQFSYSLFISPPISYNHNLTNYPPLSSLRLFSVFLSSSSPFSHALPPVTGLLVHAAVQPVRRSHMDILLRPSLPRHACSFILTGFALPRAHQESGSSSRPVCARVGLHPSS